MKARIQAGAQLDALIVTAPEPVRAPLRKLTSKQRIRACTALRPGQRQTRSRRSRPRCAPWQALQSEIDGLDTQLTPLVASVAPELLALPGAGDNRDRLRSEASFARLCGTAPIPVSSGRTDRFRLHRGGDRQVNSALWRIALVRMGCHQPTRDYVARRTAEGKTKSEIMRCLKRYIAREVFPTCLRPRPAHPVTSARPHGDLRAKPTRYPAAGLRGFQRWLTANKSPRRGITELQSRHDLGQVRRGC